MKILLADDQKEVRTGLKILLEQETALNVVDEAAEVKELLLKTHKIQPDTLLLDWELIELKVEDLVTLLKELRPGLKIVALSVRPESKKAAMEAGADAFICKGDEPEKVLEAINSL